MNKTKGYLPHVYYLYLNFYRLSSQPLPQVSGLGRTPLT